MTIVKKKHLSLKQQVFAGETVVEIEALEFKSRLIHVNQYG